MSFLQLQNKFIMNHSYINCLSISSWNVNGLGQKYRDDDFIEHVNCDIYIIMWSCPGNMPKYYPGLRDTKGRVILCFSDLGNILAYYLDKTTLISLLYWVSNCPGNMPNITVPNITTETNTKYNNNILLESWKGDSSDIKIPNYYSLSKCRARKTEHEEIVEGL